MSKSSDLEQRILAELEALRAGQDDLRREVRELVEVLRQLARRSGDRGNPIEEDSRRRAMWRDPFSD